MFSRAPTTSSQHQKNVAWAYIIKNCVYLFRWVSASTGLIAFILFMPKIFVEHSCLEEQKENIKSDPEPLKRPNPKRLFKEFSRISMVDGQLLDVSSAVNHSGKFKAENTNKLRNQRPNMLATLCSTYNFFAFLFNFVLLET